MIDQQRPIEPPPSIDDILSNQGRIGRVDFSHRLAPVAVVVQPGHAEQAEHDEPAEHHEHVQDGQDQHEDHHGEGDHADEPDPDEDTDDLGDPGDLEEVDSDELADLEPPRTVLYPADEPSGYEPTHLPRRQPTAPVTNLLSLVPAEDVTTVTDDIDDVVDGVIARIREAQHATLVHLEAIEAEAALRCEMLTAQAELDAELIRLHARREAHAIIAAARQRSGVTQPQQAEDQRRRLDQLGEAAMRLAEELEALGVDPDSPDHPFRR